MKDHESLACPGAGGYAGSGASCDEYLAGTPSLQARYQAVLDTCPTGIVNLDRNGMVLEASRAAAELMGLPREELTGVSMRVLLKPELTPFSRALAGETLTYEGSGAVNLPDGGVWVRSKWAPVHDEHGELVGGVMIVHNATSEKRATDLVDRFAFFDPVTELANRATLTIALQRALAGAQAGRRRLALLWLNIDRFKHVNDALGPAAGDHLLQAVAGRLSAAVRANDMVARVGSDDFLLLLSRAGTRPQMGRLLQRIREVFAAPFVVDGEAVCLTASCGVALHPSSGAPTPASCRRTPIRRCVTPRHWAAGAREFLRRERRRAEQPEDPLGRRPCATAWNAPSFCCTTSHKSTWARCASWAWRPWRAGSAERGLTAPRGVHPVRRRDRIFIVELGRGLFGQACAQLSAWADSLAVPPRIAFNVSAREFQRSEFCDEMLLAAARAGARHELLEVEITETAILADPVRAAAVSARLREAGVTVALDDFGTGFSSLTHLRELPIDRVKLDRSFVGHCLSDASAAVIIESVTMLAHRLGLQVVAEGVETAEELAFIRGAGCDIVQGYYSPGRCRWASARCCFGADGWRASDGCAFGAPLVGPPAVASHRRRATVW